MSPRKAPKCHPTLTRYADTPRPKPPRRTTSSSRRSSSSRSARSTVRRSPPTRRAKSSTAVRASPFGFVSRHKHTHTRAAARGSVPMTPSTKPLNVANRAASRWRRRACVLPPFRPAGRVGAPLAASAVTRGGSTAPGGSTFDDVTRHPRHRRPRRPGPLASTSTVRQAARVRKPGRASHAAAGGPACGGPAAGPAGRRRACRAA